MRYQYRIRVGNYPVSESNRRPIPVALAEVFSALDEVFLSQLDEAIHARSQSLGHVVELLQQ